MSLKSELQAINLDDLERVTRIYHSKMASLLLEEKTEEELRANIDNYPALNGFLMLMLDMCKEDGNSIEEAALMVTGASVLVSGLCELADLQEMPDIGT